MDDDHPSENSTEASQDQTVQLPPINLVPGGTTKLYRPGLSWFISRLVFPRGELQTRSELEDMLRSELSDAEELWQSDEQLVRFMADPDSHMDYWNALGDASPYRWAALFATFCSAFLNEEQPLDGEQREVMLWRVACCRTMLLFTGHLEKLAWRGYLNFGADVLADALNAWDASDKNEPEDYWQAFLEERPYLINLVFPGPVAVHQGRAYLGGKRIDNTGGKVVDFLLEHSIGGNAALLEIKRPATDLLMKTPYRGDDIYVPSRELVGAVSQILNYRDTVMTGGVITPLHVFMPSCVVLVGNYASELNNEEKRRSFELYRSSLSGVTVITYDELFTKLKGILDVLRGQ